MILKKSRLQIGQRIELVIKRIHNNFDIQFDLEYFAFSQIRSNLMFLVCMQRSHLYSLRPHARHIIHRRDKDSCAMTYIGHLPSPPRFPSAIAIADINDAARDYNVVYCGAFRSTRLHATYRGKSPMIVSRLGCSTRTNARAFQPQRVLILHNARFLPSRSFERWHRECAKKQNRTTRRRKIKSSFSQ